MEKSGVELPMVKCAFNEPATQAAWRKARRRVKRGLWLWTVLWVLSFLVPSVLIGLGVLDEAVIDVVGGVTAVTFLFYIVFLYARVSSLRCLGRIRDTLHACAWRPIPAARKVPDVKDVVGVPVRLQFRADDGDAWTDLLSARNPLRRRRWPDCMEEGAWYAGNDEGRGVLALPGGGELMEVEPRQYFQ